MPNDNRISATVPAQDKAEVLAAIQTIRTKLPFLKNLTAEERREAFKLGDKTVAFDAKCVGYMASRPELVPGFVDLSELENDRQLRTDLTDIARELGTLSEAVSDTLMMASSDALMADLSFYQNVRQAAQRGVPGADTIYNDLSQRFPGRPAKATAAAKA